MKIKLYQLIKHCHEEKGWPIDWMCRLAHISRAAYYKWLKRKPSQRELRDQTILDRILEIEQQSRSWRKTNLPTKCSSFDVCKQYLFQ